ncbi:LysE family translocator [Brevibacterium sediminis]|uniref:LysE family translocator n=1 Tax=Brevibacterium sediminis TaxID=1857024 RepID=A0A5C4X2R0_9MICO|nr:LysE family transporter [Brevibacterium sediminis]TNM55837.1 LysE family translocator [Brevibacterium sediminis]
MTGQLLAFAATCLVVIVAPGPDFVLVLRNTARAGRIGAALTAAGILTGLAVLGMAAALGATALLTTSATLSLIIRIAGGLYLIWLGLQSLRSWLRLRSERSATAVAVDPDARLEVSSGTRWSCFRQGLVSNLLNPKVVAFYLALFPQFELSPLSPATTHIVLAAAFWTLCLMWYIALVSLIGSIGTRLQRPKFARRIEAVAGSTLMALGGFVLARAH